MKKLLLGAVTGLVLLGSPSLQAQDLARVYFLTPKPGNGPAVRAALADHTNWLREQGDEWAWGVFQVIQGDNLGDWIFRTAGHDWSDFDERDEGFGIRAVERFQNHVVPLLSSLRSEVTQIDPALTNNPTDTGYTLFHITQWRVTDQAAYNQGIGRALDAYRDQGHEYHATYHNVLVGPELPRKTRVRWYRSWEEFANAPNTVELMNRAYGEEETARILQNLNESADGTDDYVVRSYPEMSVPGM